jgi:hypothetical protein
VGLCIGAGERTLDEEAASACESRLSEKDVPTPSRSCRKPAASSVADASFTRKPADKGDQTDKGAHPRRHIKSSVNDAGSFGSRRSLSSDGAADKRRRGPCLPSWDMALLHLNGSRAEVAKRLSDFDVRALLAVAELCAFVATRANFASGAEQLSEPVKSLLVRDGMPLLAYANRSARTALPPCHSAAATLPPPRHRAATALPPPAYAVPQAATPRPATALPLAPHIPMLLC